MRLPSLLLSLSAVTTLFSVGRPCQACSFLVSNFDATANEARLRHANYYNQLRGPDATNVEHVRGWTFLHNLLSMTGSVTLQPFIKNDVVAVFNGEIYNYRELAAELAEGDVDREKEYQASDGLVLVPAYEKWGTSFVKRLHGEFALVVVDFAKRRVLLSTDVFSTKPLWYGVWPCGEETFDGGGADNNVCFLAASYESVLARLGVPGENRIMADPNEVLVLSMDRDDDPFVETSLSRESVFEFDLNQHKSSTEDWRKAFMKAVKIRTDRIKHKVFIGLSGGFDSGAIMLALELLNKPFFAYSVATAKDNMTVVQKRLEYSKRASGTIIHLDAPAFKRQHLDLVRRCEPYQYVFKQAKPNYFVTDELAAVGLSFILSKVRSRGGLIYLSGSGADETISDYGMHGKRIFTQSCFAGVFPENLTAIFPWCNFYHGTQRAYLMKEELTGGAHGIETRYPFLDPNVVQEYLWLTAETKNSEYKRPVADFLRIYDFPNMYSVKAGFGVETFNRSSEQNIGGGDTYYDDDTQKIRSLKDTMQNADVAIHGVGAATVFFLLFALRKKIAKKGVHRELGKEEKRNDLKKIF